ncbi:hypothetical protein, partial [Ralstonia chuxiongensis]|uniref:hypothetical protein n=1 Tax=Ralstonia chuxiongensis TaxID=2957504 RepID=UPI00292CD51C
SLSTPIICSSVNRFFMTAPLRNGLYIVNVLITGSRSAHLITDVIPLAGDAHHRIVEVAHDSILSYVLQLGD